MRDARIAVEGCGHGTLKAIYASVEKSCEAKGWPSVDLVIIGGDFQVGRLPNSRLVRFLTCLRQSAIRWISTAWQFR